MERPDMAPLELARALDLVQDDDEGALENTVNEVIKEFPLKVEAYQQGKTGIVAMFMGEVMKRTRGKVDPKKANALIVKKLSEK
jgi:aspartyl-tRNA(Asn)/glutamyl-tRNA(Gln) amidotransferase subunit B